MAVLEFGLGDMESYPNWAPAVCTATAPCCPSWGGRVTQGWSPKGRTVQCSTWVPSPWLPRGGWSHVASTSTLPSLQASAGMGWDPTGPRGGPRGSGASSSCQPLAGDLRLA